MCQYLSAIGRKNGDIYHSEYTDSHEYLLLAGGFRDPAEGREANWCRIEYRPENTADLVDISKYELRIDQEAPAWLKETIKAKWEAKLKVIAAGNIINGGTVPILLGGKHIVCGGAEIKYVIGGIIPVLSGGTVQEVLSGGTVQEVWSGGTVQKVLSGGTVQEVLSGGTVQEVWPGGTVQKVWSGGTVQKVWSGGTVQKVLSGGTVQEVWSGAIVNGKIKK